MAPDRKGYGIALLSGGLDSILSIRLLLEQGVRVDALHFASVFNAGTLDLGAVTENLGVRLDVFDHTEDLVEAVQRPLFGYGRHLNPCIDCHGRMLRRADAVRVQRGADFLVTGEVLGQRPKSQLRHALPLVEKAGDVGGLVLRPLSAKRLAETRFEREGLVDRARLLGLSGRSRKEQLRLAGAFGIRDYLTPAGGCLLTQAEYAARVKDLLDHGCFSSETARTLSQGRHFRLDAETRVVIGRNQDDNRRVEASALRGDVLLVTRRPPGPVALVTRHGSGGERRTPGDEAVRTAAAWTAAFTRTGPDGAVELEARTVGQPDPARKLETRPASRETFAEKRISGL
jgi:tRNA U34 2-thiouridine synthase MnmA/TrmU